MDNALDHHARIPAGPDARIHGVEADQWTRRGYGDRRALGLSSLADN